MRVMQHEVNLLCHITWVELQKLHCIRDLRSKESRSPHWLNLCTTSIQKPTPSSSRCASRSLALSYIPKGHDVIRDVNCVGEMTAYSNVRWGRYV